MAKIKVVYKLIKDGEKEESGDICEKPEDQAITIGRNSSNDIAPNMPFVSREHGKITCTKGSFLSRKLFYEDMSTYGTWYLLPGINDISKSVLIHKQKVEIKTKSTLLLLDPKQKKFGLALEVIVS